MLRNNNAETHTYKIDLLKMIQSRESDGKMRYIRITFKKSQSQGENSRDDAQMLQSIECGVCTQILNSESQPLLNPDPNCLHTFCHDCWMKCSQTYNSVCPLCRYPFQFSQLKRNFVLYQN